MTPRITDIAQHQYICQWKECDPPTTGHVSVINVYVRPVVVGLDRTSRSPEHITLENVVDRAKTALSYLCTAAQTIASRAADSMVAVKLLLPTRDGYLVRSDILRQRLRGCDLVDSVSEFSSNKDYLSAPDMATVPNLHFAELVKFAIGAMTAQLDRHIELSGIMDALSGELIARLSLPIIASLPLTRNRMVVVGSRHQLVMEDWFETVHQLGINVTLIGPEGHFLQDARKRYPAVEKFLAIDMSLDNELSSRILHVLKEEGSDFHGITTFKDPYLTHVAKVAKILNLPTAPFDAVHTCVDKHLTRMAVGKTSEALRIKDLTGLKLQMSNASLNYPLIVKPCAGYGSEGVFRVTQEKELVEAVSALVSAPDQVDILIDSYAEGPEIDANFVIYDGELLFFELVDGFPCTAEDSKEGNFLETDQMWPSNHPCRERDMLKTEIHATLLHLGFRTGVFHVEARIQGSAMEYNFENELRDLRPRGQTTAAEPSYFLLEINQRPPGHGGMSATKWVHGIDYLALYSLCALADRERVTALSQPFAFTEGVQGWCDSVFLNASNAGIYDGEDIPAIMRVKHSDLMKEVVYSACYYHNGDQVFDDPPRIALFVVASKLGRLHVRQVAQKLREVAQRYVRMR